MLEIKGSVAVITGGASGIGLALARHWVQQGGKVVIGDVVDDALDRVKQELGTSVGTVHCDVTQEAQCAALADTAIEKFGQINLVAPFAGIIMDKSNMRPPRRPCR